jgi:membrane protease subunit (stomatin/prohibitin family)
MDIVAGIMAGVAGLGGLLDDFIFTDQEREQIEAQKQAAQAQVEAAQLAREKAVLEAASRARQAQALMILGVTLGAAIVVAALVWRSA